MKNNLTISIIVTDDSFNITGTCGDKNIPMGNEQAARQVAKLLHDTSAAMLRQLDGQTGKED